MQTFLSSNIRFLRKKLGLTQSELADKIGVNRAMVGSYEEDRAVPKVSVLQNLAYYFQVLIDDLFNRDLSQGEHPRADVKGQSMRVLSTIVDRDDREMISVVPVKAAAGYMTGYGDPEFIEALPRFTLPLPELHAERTYRAFQIRGDSMDPIPSGSYVIGEYIQDWGTLKDGHAHVIVSKNDGIVYKRAYNKIEESGELLLKSDNPAYDSYRVSVHDVIDIWKAIGYISLQLPEPDEMSLSRINTELEHMRRELENLKNTK